MKTSNAIKKLEKHNFAVSQVGNNVEGRRGARIIEFIDQQDSAICVRARCASDVDDIMSDYFAGVWCDNISQALRISS